MEVEAAAAEAAVAVARSSTPRWHRQTEDKRESPHGESESRDELHGAVTV